MRILHFFWWACLVVLTGCNLYVELDPIARSTPDLDVAADIETAADMAVDLVSDTSEVLDARADATQDMAPEFLWTLPTDRPARILILGSAVTESGDLPNTVTNLARDAGWQPPRIELQTQANLGEHLTMGGLDQLFQGEPWDAVVLQDSTEHLLDDARSFSDDVARLTRLIQTASPSTHIVVVQNWPYAPTDGAFADTFADPFGMAQAIEATTVSAISQTGSSNPETIEVVPVAAVFLNYGRSHDIADLYDGTKTASELGHYTYAMTMFSVLFRGPSSRSHLGLVSLEDAENVQASIAAVFPRPLDLVQTPTMSPTQTLQLDFGITPTNDPSWNSIVDDRFLINVSDAMGMTTSVDFEITTSFLGENTQGPANTLLGLPQTATQDLFFVGSFADHAAGLANPGAFRLLNVPQGVYRVEVFASRNGVDGVLDRLTRVEMDGAYQDIDAADNQAILIFDNVSPAADGSLDVSIQVSPDGTGRFAYINTLRLGPMP